MADAAPAPLDRSEAALRERFASVQARMKAHKRAERRSRLNTGLAVVALSGALAWTVAQNNRLAQRVATRPAVYSVMQPNGEFVSSDDFEEVAPPGEQTLQIQSALWQYVTSRDCYGFQSFWRQAYIAQAMSDQRVGKQVHEQLALSNPQSPQHVYGEHGIAVGCELIEPPSPIGDGQYFFRFRRWEDNGRISAADRANAPIFAVTVGFGAGVFPPTEAGKRYAWADRVTFNPAGVQVIDYPGAQPEVLRPSGQPPHPRQASLANKP